MSEKAVTHPKLVNIKGIRFRVITGFPLTDHQALVIAAQFYRMKKFTKKDLGHTFELRSAINSEIAAQL